MRLVADGRMVELSLVGYQFTDRAASIGGFDWDANWLRISAHVVDGAREWHFDDPCLTTREARELLGWLRRAAAGEVHEDALRFTEPNLHFSVGGGTDERVAVTIWFAQESAPPDVDDATRHGDGHEVTLRVSAADLTRAADEWERELGQSPER